MSNNNLSIIEVSNIYIEDLFRMFHDSIKGSCGDGAGLIVCKNYQYASELFERWLKENDLYKWMHPKDEYGNIINYHDSNENFMFSDTIYSLWRGDYIFIIRQDCYWCGIGPKDNNIKLEATNVTI